VLSGFIPFIARNYPSKSYPVVESFFSALRRSTDAKTPIGAAGFCWGGKHTVLLAHGASTDVNGVSTRLIDAGFTGHPSFLSVPGDIEKLVVPVSFALGELDSVLKGESIGVVQRIVEEKEEVGGEVRVYLGAGHGFCVRADTAAGDSSRQAGEAEEQAVAFFQRVFGRRR
jgi:dienelactone hydrolase